MASADGFFEDEAFEEEAEEVVPRGYGAWARKAAAAYTGVRQDYVGLAEDVLLEHLRPGWPAEIVAEEQADEFPEDPAERARHRVWALHRAVGFTREELHLVVEVEPTSPDPDDRRDGQLAEPQTVKVYALGMGDDDPAGGFVITPVGILGADQVLLAEKEETLCCYACRNERELRALHEKIYRWMPRPEALQKRARERAERLRPVADELLVRLEDLEQYASQMDLEDEIYAVRSALEQLRAELDEVGFDEEEHRRFMHRLYTEHDPSDEQDTEEEGGEP